MLSAATRIGPYEILALLGEGGMGEVYRAKWVSYQSDESGKLQIYVRPFPPGAGASGKWQISLDGGVGARWRGDGKELFYFASPFYWLNYAPSPDGRRFLIAVPAEQENALPMTVVLNCRR